MDFIASIFAKNAAALYAKDYRLYGFNRAFAVLLLTCGLVPSAHAAPHDISSAGVVASFVDGYVKPTMHKEQSPSGAVAIAKNENVIFAKGYGYQDLEKRVPVDVNKTLFRPGSVSKLFTWVAVMQQVEKGRLDLDIDVNTYLRKFQIEDEQSGKPITLRHIMTHTTGFEDGFLGYLIMDDFERVVPLVDSLKKYQPKRVNPPGKQIAYSNYASALAGHIVANVSGVEFNDYIKANIFDVLGMRNSSFDEPLPSSLVGNMAVAYKKGAIGFEDKPFEVVSNFAPAGALSATAADMIKFGMAMLGGGSYQGQRILQEATVNEMLSRQFSHDPRISGMALGFWETTANGFTVFGHWGDTFAFHSGLAIDRVNQIVYFVSFTANGGETVRTNFKTAFYNHFYPIDAKLPEAPDDFAKRAKKFTGAYKSWRTGFSHIEKLLSLPFEVKVTQSSSNGLLFGLGSKNIELFEVDKNLFLVAEPLVAGPIPEPTKLAFQEDESGEIIGFVVEGLPYLSMYKARWYESTNFNYPALIVSLLLFLGVLARNFYQRTILVVANAEDKSARRVTVIVAVANLATVIVAVAVVISAGDALLSEIPTSFKLMLVLPMLAFLAGIYQLTKTVQVWFNGLLSSTWERLRYSLVTLAACFMCWFYWFWNILGLQYMN